MSNTNSVVSAVEEGVRFNAVVRNAIASGQIREAFEFGEDGTEACVLDLIDDLAAVLGTPSDEEIIDTANGFVQKLDGMAADAIVLFAGYKVVIMDGPEDDTFEVKCDEEDSFHAIYSFEDDVMLVDTLNDETESKLTAN